MRLASELKMALDEVKAKTTSSQFVRWCVELDARINEFNPLYQYLAQIATETRRGYARHPGRVKLADLILKFTRKDKEKKVDKTTAAHWAKARWFGMLGLGRDGKPRGKVRKRKSPK